MNLVIGIGGGIAAFKVLSFIRLAIKAGIRIKVILTQNGKHFVTPETIQALTSQPVYQALWDEALTGSLNAIEQADFEDHGMVHIKLAKWADYILVAPATANRMQQLASGSADDLLGNVILASDAPLAIAPAMNCTMWQHPATQANFQCLLQRGVVSFGPVTGEQACGDNGIGRLMEAEQLFEAFISWTQPFKLPFKHLLITVGATVEPIDPVRFISNSSSGAMGLCLAVAAFRAGLQVTVIQGRIDKDLLSALPSGIRCIPVMSAEQMLNQVVEQLPSCDLFIAAAAVSDFRVDKVQTQKIKKTSNQLTLQLVANPDIIFEVSKLAKAQQVPPFIVGFALESENLLANAQGKLVKKAMDLIIANDVATIASTNSEATALWHDKSNQLQTQLLPHTPKPKQAVNILQLIAKIKTTECGMIRFV